MSENESAAKLGSRSVGPPPSIVFPRAGRRAREELRPASLVVDREEDAAYFDEVRSGSFSHFLISVIFVLLCLPRACR